MKLSMFGEAITMNKAKLLGIAMALTVLGTSVNVVSATEDTKLEMPYDVYTWTETVDAVVKKNDDSTISVHCDTMESEELYNYITVSTIFPAGTSTITVRGLFKFFAKSFISEKPLIFF